ncbi:EAL domain-containing protein [Paraburkholderia sp. LEh10]|uniref:EAL domain-containing protein n=1 Tax=Paraburkholderia sp. LEh10 TaxID=2821353 RepID=UPI0039181542
MRRGEFCLEYQPVMSLREGKCVGVDAMIRWTNAEHGLKGPADYMRILGKTRLIARLTRFVLSTAARDLAELMADSSLYIGVNVYSDHVENRGFASDVIRSAKAIRSRLVLNMSQLRCAAPTIDVQGTVAALRAKRVRFASMPLSLLVTFLEAGGESLRMRKKKRWKLR